MIALTRTHSKTALLCFAFLLAGAGCEQKADTTQQDTDVATTEATTDTAHDEQGHANHDDHEHGHEGHSHEESSHEQGHDHSHEGHSHNDADMTTYNCQPEQVIKAHYDPANDPQSATSAHLLIDGVEYDLTAMTASTTNAGTTYETDIGITDESGMRWKLNTDATKAVLSNKTLGSSVAESDETVLFDCQKTDG
ncbi:hypothetical protein ACT3TH_00835 [Psychrobacter sp. AOP22-C1-C5]|uniref:hypothetical protein n=1 Tax=Psychrobacter sp. AOP22-C1-C5 TaxID=3457716 RepID=UPI0040355A84